MSGVRIHAHGDQVRKRTWHDASAASGISIRSSWSWPPNRQISSWRSRIWPPCYATINSPNPRQPPLRGPDHRAAFFRHSPVRHQPFPQVIYSAKTRSNSLALINYNNDPQQVGCAISTDGLQWTRLFRQPLLPNEQPGDWNASETGDPGVFQDDDGRTYPFVQGNRDRGHTWFLSCVELGWRAGRPWVMWDSPKFPTPRPGPSAHHGNGVDFSAGSGGSGDLCEDGRRATPHGAGERSAGGPAHGGDRGNRPPSSGVERRIRPGGWVRHGGSSCF